MTIAELIKAPEGKTTEFKRDASPLKRITRTIVAFANTAGGSLFIGIEDPLSVEEKLTSSIADSIEPMIMPDIEIVSVEGKAILCIRVAHWPGPFYIKSEGSERGVYIRLGSSTRPAGPEFIAEMKRQLESQPFDRLPCPTYSTEALDHSLIEQKFGEIGREIKEQQLVSLGILIPFAGRNVVTNGGLILFGKPDVKQVVLPDAWISCARFRDTTKAHFLDRLDLEGSALEALSRIPAFISRNSRLFSKIEGMVRHDIPAYPAPAIREILVNSIVHCDYSLTRMRIMVAIYSDRLEIQSPGILPFGMTLEDFKAGLSKIRNRVIARTFRELGLMEEWGSGYKRINEFCSWHGYPLPEWQEFGPSLRVTIFPHPEAEEVPPSYPPPVKQLLVACQEGSSGRGQLQELLGIKNKKYFLDTYLRPAIGVGMVEMTIPDKPNSKLQQYRLTDIGRKWVEINDKK